MHMRSFFPLFLDTPRVPSTMYEGIRQHVNDIDGAEVCFSLQLSTMPEIVGQTSHAKPSRNSSTTHRTAKQPGGKAPLKT